MGSFHLKIHHNRLLKMPETWQFVYIHVAYYKTIHFQVGWSRNWANPSLRVITDKNWPSISTTNQFNKNKDANVNIQLVRIYFLRLHPSMIKFLEPCQTLKGLLGYASSVRIWEVPCFSG